MIQAKLKLNYVHQALIAQSILNVFNDAQCVTEQDQISGEWGIASAFLPWVNRFRVRLHQFWRTAPPVSEKLPNRGTRQSWNALNPTSVRTFIVLSNYSLTTSGAGGGEQ